MHTSMTPPVAVFLSVYFRRTVSGSWTAMSDSLRRKLTDDTICDMVSQTGLENPFQYICDLNSELDQMYTIPKERQRLTTA